MQERPVTALALLRGGTAAAASRKPSRGQARAGSPGRRSGSSQPSPMPLRLAYSRRTSGVSCSGSTENETSVTPGAAARISFMRAVIVGQTPPQRVKMNPATQGRPAQVFARRRPPRPLDEGERGHAAQHRGRRRASAPYVRADSGRDQAQASASAAKRTSGPREREGGGPASATSPAVSREGRRAAAPAADGPRRARPAGGCARAAGTRRRAPMSEIRGGQHDQDGVVELAGQAASFRGVRERGLAHRALRGRRRGRCSSGRRQQQDGRRRRAAGA